MVEFKLNYKFISEIFETTEPIELILQIDPADRRWTERRYLNDRISGTRITLDYLSLP